MGRGQARFWQEKSLIHAIFYWNWETLARVSLQAQRRFPARVAKVFFGCGFSRPGRGCKDALRRVEPNRYFTGLGLFCLLEAKDTEIASLRKGANH